MRAGRAGVLGAMQRSVIAPDPPPAVGSMEAMHERAESHERAPVSFRLYRLAMVPLAIAVVVLMFSLGGTPGPLEPATPTGTFDGARAATVARQVAERAPERPAGSPGDEATADLVAERFGEIFAGSVTEQEFEAEVGGETVGLRNVLLTLPGDSAETVVIAAGRDSREGAGGATGAAATGVLVELASALGLSGHDRTYVLASTTGSVDGAAGVRALFEGLPERDAVATVIVVSQPGAVDPRGPFVVSSSTGPETGPIQLERTAELAVETQTGESSPQPSGFTQLARLAIPSGLGDQAPLIADGFDAVAISSAGESPLDGSEPFSRESVDGFGRAVQATVAAVDAAPASGTERPEAKLAVSDNVVPGWTLALLALTLILPAAAVALEALVRAGRGGGPVAGSLAWAAARALPFLGGAGALYGLAAIGAIPSPPFPFDPGAFGLGTRAAVGLGAVALVGAASAFVLRRRGVTAGSAPGAAVPAVGAVATAACLVCWLVNPYLSLLAAGAAHAWLLAARRPGPFRGPLAVAGSALACVPVAAALAATAGDLDLGTDAPWTFALMVADGQIGLATVLAACFAAGSLVAGPALALRRERLPGRS